MSCRLFADHLHTTRNFTTLDATHRSFSEMSLCTHGQANQTSHDIDLPRMHVLAFATSFSVNNVPMPVLESGMMPIHGGLARGPLFDLPTNTEQLSSATSNSLLIASIEQGQPDAVIPRKKTPASFYFHKRHIRGRHLSPNKMTLTWIKNCNNPLPFFLSFFAPLFFPIDSSAKPRAPRCWSRADSPKSRCCADLQVKEGC